MISPEDKELLRRVEGDLGINAQDRNINEATNIEVRVLRCLVGLHTELKQLKNRQAGADMSGALSRAPGR